MNQNLRKYYLRPILLIVGIGTIMLLASGLLLGRSPKVLTIAFLILVGGGVIIGAFMYYLLEIHAPNWVQKTIHKLEPIKKMGFETLPGQGLFGYYNRYFFSISPVTNRSGKSMLLLCVFFQPGPEFEEKMPLPEEFEEQSFSMEREISMPWGRVPTIAEITGEMDGMVESLIKTGMIPREVKKEQF